MALLFCACLAAGGVTAATDVPVAFGLEVEGSARWQGDFRGKATAAGVVYQTGVSPDGTTLTMSLSQARVRLINSPRLVEGDREGPIGWHGETPMEPETLVDEERSGTLRLTLPTANGSIRLLPANEQFLTVDLQNQQSWTLSPVSDWFRIAGSDALRLPDDATRSTLLPEGAGARLSLDAAQAVTAAGPLLAFLYGGTYELRRSDGTLETFETGERLNKSRTATDPDGRAGVWWYDRLVLLVEDEQASAELGVHRVSGLTLAIRALDGKWAGDLSLSDAQGRLQVDDASHDAGATLLQIIGEFEGRSDYARPIGTWIGNGSATFVAVDARTLAGDRAGQLNAALAVGGIGLAAVLLASLTQAGRELLTFVLGRNVAKPLDSAVRLTFVRTIARTPGIGLRALALGAGVTKWGARHHVAILKRAEIIEQVDNGNAYGYVLNGQTHQFRIPAMGGRRVSASQTWALTSHPKRQLIRRALEGNAPTHYAQMVETWKWQGVPPPYPSPSDVTYHCKIMERAGVVGRRRVDRNVLWSWEADLTGAQRHAANAFIRHAGVAAILDAIRGAAGLDARQIADEVSGRFRRRRMNVVRETLLLVEQVGLVQAVGGRYFIKPLHETSLPTTF